MLLLLKLNDVAHCEKPHALLSFVNLFIYLFIPWFTMLNSVSWANFGPLEWRHIFRAERKEKHLIRFQKEVKENKCNGCLLSPAGSVAAQQAQEPSDSERIKRERQRMGGAGFLTLTHSRE